MNEKDLNIELIANIDDLKFAIEDVVFVETDHDDASIFVAKAKIKLLNESFFRTIQLTEKGYNQIEPDDDDEDWFETLSTLLQTKSESFQNQMMQTLFSKLIEIEQ